MYKELLIQHLETTKIYLYDIQSDLDFIIKHNLLNTITDLFYKDSNLNITYIENDKPKSIKLSRFLLSILGSGFPSNVLEKICYIITGIYEKKVPLEVSGTDIIKFYDGDNYKYNGVKNDDGEYIPSTIKGSLSKSCMRYKSCLENLDLYTQNTDKVKLWVFLDEDGKVVTRALLWSLDNGLYLLDRVYFHKESDMISMMEYARTKGHLVMDTIHWNPDRYTLLGSSTRNSYFPVFTIKLENKPEKFPYLDTFRYFDPNEGILYTKLTESTPVTLDLRRTDGYSNICTFNRKYYHGFYTWNILLPFRLNDHLLIMEERFNPEEITRLWETIFYNSRELLDTHLLEFYKRIKNHQLLSPRFRNIIFDFISKKSDVFSFNQFIQYFILEKDKNIQEFVLNNKDMVIGILNNNNLILNIPDFINEINKRYNIVSLLSNKQYQRFCSIILNESDYLCRLDKLVQNDIFNNFEGWEKIKLKNISILDVDDIKWPKSLWKFVLLNNKILYFNNTVLFYEIWKKRVPDDSLMDYIVSIPIGKGVISGNTTFQQSISNYTYITSKF